MNFHSGIIGSLFLIGFSLMAFFVTKKANYSSFYLKLLGYLAIVIGILAINVVLVVVAPRVPYQLKDGSFGGAGGILFGSCMVNVVLGGILLGLVWNKSNKPNIDGVLHQLSIAEEKNRYPGGFNNFAHSTIGGIGGITIAWLLISLFKHRNLWEEISIIGVVAATSSGIYLIVLVAYLIFKKKSVTTSA